MQDADRVSTRRLGTREAARWSFHVCRSIFVGELLEQSSLPEPGVRSYALALLVVKADSWLVHDGIDRLRGCTLFGMHEAKFRFMQEHEVLFMGFWSEIKPYS